MVVAMVGRLLRELDREGLADEVRRFREKNGRLGIDEQAGKLVKRTARRCAVMGALLPNFPYLVFRQSRLVFSLSLLYGREPSAPERLAEVALCLGAGMGSEIVRRGALEAIERGFESRALARALRRAGAKDHDGFTRLAAPVVGTIAGGAVHYWSVVTVGRLAIRYYSRP